MSVPLPPGFSVRPVSLDDVDALFALMAASAFAAVGETDVTRDEVVDNLSHVTLDLAHDTWLVLDAAASVVGYSVVYHDNDERVFVDPYVHPDLDEQTYQATFAWLMQAGLAQLRHYLPESAGTTVIVSSGCYRGETRQSSALLAHGMTLARTYFRMRRELSPSDVIVVELPPGVTVRAPNLADDDERHVVHKIATDSFREHHGFVEETSDAFWADFGRTPLFDPTQWWVAYVDGVPAGLLIGNEVRAAENGAYIPTLGVLPAYRGRGVAKTLLRLAFSEFARRGRTSVSLGVDSENATGATTLYESVGMTSTLTIDFYELTMQA